MNIKQTKNKIILAVYPKLKRFKIIRKIFGKRYQYIKHKYKKRKNGFSTSEFIKQRELFLSYQKTFRCSMCKTQCIRTEEQQHNTLTIDHIIPLSLGGKNNMTNFRILCLDCHTYINKIHNRRMNKMLKTKLSK